MLRYIDTSEGLPLLTGSVPPATHLNWINPGTSWSQDSGTASYQVAAGIGVGSDRSLVFAQNGSVYFGSMRIPLGAAITTKFVVGALVRVANYAATGLPSSSVGFIRVGLDLNSTPTSTDTLRVTNTGALGINGALSAAGVVTANNNFYVELEYDLTAGTLLVYVNNTLVITTTTTLTSVTGFCLGWSGVAISFQARFDNFYVVDDQPGGPTTRLGPSKVVRTPLSASLQSNFVPSGGAANNLAAVNKNDLSTTTYNQSPAANGVRDMFSLDASGVGSGDIVHGVAVRSFYRKSDVGPRSLSMVAGDGSNETVTPLADNLAFASHNAIILNSAPDGTAWDQTKLAALQVGYEVNA